MLLNIADDQLHFEIVGVLLCDFVEPVIDWLQSLQAGHEADLLVQTLQFFKRIQILIAHVRYPTLSV
jgi:hypothetical protein